MKKKLFIILALLVVLLMSGSFGYANASALPIDDSTRLKDIIVKLALPTIEKAVDDFYKPYLNYTPSVAAYYDTKIVDIKSNEGIYTVVVEVYPYIGPHNALGKDRITLSITPSGVITVEKFEHLQSYELPSRYQQYVLKPLP